jgi:diguanylate cyclase (GGDEF)-like protein
MESPPFDASSPTPAEATSDRRAPERPPLASRPAGMAMFSLVLVAVALGWATLRSDGGFRGIDSGAVPVTVLGAVATLGAAAAVFRAASTRVGRSRQAWAAAGAGPVLLAAGTVVLVVGGHPASAETATTITGHTLQVGGLVLISVAAALMPATARPTAVTHIDTALVVLAGLSLMWLAPLRTSQGPVGGLTEVVRHDPWAVSAAVAILVGAAMVVRCTPGRRPELRPLVVALLAYPAAIYTALVADDTGVVTVAARVSQLWWLVAPVVLLGAGSRAWSTWREPPNKEARAERLTSGLPAVAVVVTLACVAVHQRVMTSLDPVMMIVGALTVLLAAARLRLLQAQQTRLLEELHDLAGELGDQARRDELTGLGNRLALEERLHEALRRVPEHGVSAFFVDVDNFKNVNDALGHDAGDRLLVELSLRLTDVLGGDVFRIGGDEFVAVRDDLDESRAEVMAGALVATLAPPVAIDGRPVSAASSVGLARSRPRDSGDGPDRRPDDGEGLLRRADLALYRAKELGRSRWASYDSWLQDRADRRLHLQHGLRRALDRDEFELRFQPIVDLPTRQVVGAEALLRWDTPDHGLLLPDEFLPLAAEAGLLPEIGRVVLRTAVARLDGAVLHDGSPLWLAINVSAQEVAHDGLVDDVITALRDRDVAPHRLHLEFTERVVTDPATTATIDRLGTTGVGLTVQDFGTAASSLRRLSSLPDPTIKVDRSFVAGLGRRRGDRLVLEAVAELADDLGITLTADGVSQEVQAAELLRLGAVRAQGWLFGPAVAWTDFAAAHLDVSEGVALGSGA